MAAELKALPLLEEKEAVGPKVNSSIKPRPKRVELVGMEKKAEDARALIASTEKNAEALKISAGDFGPLWAEIANVFKGFTFMEIVEKEGLRFDQGLLERRFLMWYVDCRDNGKDGKGTITVEHFKACVAHYWINGSGKGVSRYVDVNVEAAHALACFERGKNANWTPGRVQYGMAGLEAVLGAEVGWARCPTMVEWYIGSGSQAHLNAALKNVERFAAWKGKKVPNVETLRKVYVARRESFMKANPTTQDTYNKRLAAFSVTLDSSSEDNILKTAYVAPADKKKKKD